MRHLIIKVVSVPITVLVASQKMSTGEYCLLGISYDNRPIVYCILSLDFVTGHFITPLDPAQFY